MKNIVLITADEMRADCTGFSGNPDVKTPHLDKLAALGTVFKKHFTPFPKCVPARVSMLTGRYTHTDGLRTVMEENHITPDVPTLTSFLRTQGYETAMLGLNHVWKMEDFYGCEADDGSHQPGVVDYTSFTPGVMADLAKKPRTYPEGQEREGPGPEGLRKAKFAFKGLQSGTVARFSDDNRTDQACVVLRELRNPEKPFFLQLNLSDPHPPYQIHEPWYSMYDPEKITAFPFEMPEGAPLPLTAQRKWRTGEDFPAESSCELQAIYYGMISFIDDLVGQVVAEVDSLGLAENTLIIFTSDHGDYAGQFGLIEKWDASLHDCLLHVPMIMAGAGVPQGKEFSGFSEHIDLADTLLEYLNLETGPEWVRHGTSMIPALQGACLKQAVFADGGHEEAMRSRFVRDVWEEKDGVRTKATDGKQLAYQQCPDSMARCKMVRTDTWKLVIRETGGNELYNMIDDPRELQNLYGQPEHATVVSELQLKLIEWCLCTDTDRPYLQEFGA